jgi:transcription antitermination factor NusG
MQEKHWYAVYTKPRWEKKVTAMLTARGLEAYCPLNRVVKQWSDRKKQVEIPLFSSYSFVCITEAQKEAVRRVEGVLNFVYWNGKPAQIRNEEIAAIRYFVNQYSNIVLEPLDLKVGDTIEIPEGVFKGQPGEIVKVEKKRVEVSLYQLRMKLTVALPAPSAYE